MSNKVSATPTIPSRDVDDRLVAALCRAAEGEPGSAEMAVREHVGRLAPLADPDERERLVGAAVARLDGLGPLDALVRDRSIDEVLVNGEGEIWVDRRGALAQVGWITATDLAVVTERILAPLGRRLDRTTPIVDARLADGTRVCAVVPPISVDGAVLSLRRFRSEPLPLSAFGPDAVVVAIAELVERRCNVVVSGATSSGKTSLLNSLLGLVPPGERLVLLEDTAELAPRCDHVVRLEARPASNDGLAAVTVEQLLHTALRLRPDRLIVGEARGSEVLGLVQALNTGHDGSWSTCHANSALDALHRLETLVVQTAPAWPLRAVRDHLLRCIDAVVHVERVPGGGRRVAEIAEVVGGDGVPAVRPIVSGGARVADLSRNAFTGAAVNVNGLGAAVACTLGVVVLAGRVGAHAPPPREAATSERGPRRRRHVPRRRRAQAPRASEVADWCDGVARELRSGSSLGAAIAAGTTTETAMSRVVAPVARRVARGESLLAALDAAVRPGDGIDAASHAGLALTVLRSCACFGGPAAAPLQRAAATLRARDAVAAEQLAQSAQARLSARVLTLVPVVLLALLAITDPKVRATLATPAGLVLVGLGALLNVAGALWMRRIIGSPR